MKKIFIHVLLLLCITFVVIKNKDAQAQNYKFIDNQVNKLFSETNNKWNKFQTFEEAQHEAKKYITDDNLMAEIAIPFGFFMEVDFISEFCEPTGYIPHKYIMVIDSYKKNINFHEKLLTIFQRTDLDNEQSEYFVKTLLEGTKKMGKDHFNRLTENEYKSIQKSNPTFTKKEYCKLYDERSEEIVSTKLNAIKDHAPNIYEKYFK